jgi:hypothetical protein
MPQSGVVMTIREGRWRCPRCNRENLGRERDCRGCGEPRGDDVVFYLPEEAPEVEDEALLTRARAGTEKLCEFCDAANPPEAEVCTGCGAPLTERRREEVFHPVASPTLDPPPPPPRPSPRRRGVLALGCIGLLVASGLVGIAVLGGKLWREGVQLEVAAVSWELTFETERQVTVTRTGWQGELPAGARPLSSRRAQRGTRQVQIGTTTGTEAEQVRVQVGTEKVKVGTRDLGNGFFEDVYEERPVYENRTRERKVTRPVYREEPVWGTEVTYQLEEWQLARNARNDGSDRSPVWPSLEEGERERPGSRREVCRVFLTAEGGKRFVHEVSASELTMFEPGRVFRGEVDAFGKLRSLRPSRVESGS